ncbi:nitrate ABC transporter permease [Pandoraea terrae]|uniref:Thiamine pyrimidine synthase n=1 Tax=Pandoraea terrae TaxID=1537710 RepID=A0A5E4XTM6_9BURK|nr:ABC transporter substrate-binding protein [Pandoraea terrae]VVE39719.1 nitrate ABC transporter permease [Pandoraea terrae]
MLNTLRRHVLSRIALVAAAFVVLPAAQATDRVRFNLAWLPQGSTGGVVVALAKGYYKAAGLDVTLLRGYGGQRTVNEIDQGQFELGYGDPVSVILNRSHGGKTVMVGAINTRWPGALCYLLRPDLKIHSIKDLAGMTLGGGGASPVQNIMSAWLKKNGLPPDAIKTIRFDPAVINTALLDKRIDLAECWEGASLPVQQALAQRAGRQLGWIRYRDYGLDMMGSGIVTTDNMIATKPDVVRRFVKATYQGYDFLHDHPAEAAEVIAAQYPLLDKTILLQQITQTNGLLRDDPEHHKPGWLRPERMTATVDFVSRAFNLGSTVKASDIYSNQFTE